MRPTIWLKATLGCLPSKGLLKAMTKPIGRVVELVRYPVKSMAGIASESGFLGWHGLDGDRRFAFRRVGDKSGFPWLSASRLAELILYRPCGQDERTGEPLPTHVRTPAGVERELWSAELHREDCLYLLRCGLFRHARVVAESLAKGLHTISLQNAFACANLLY